MSGVLSPFHDMVKNIAEPMKKLEQLKSPLVEVQDLLATGSALSSTISTIHAEPLTNFAALYDSVSTIHTLSENALVRFDSPEVKQIAEVSKKTVDTVRKDVSFEQANMHLFEYYEDLSDLIVVSKSMEEVCQKLAGSEKPESLWDLIKNFFEDLKSRINIVVDRVKGVIGKVGQELISAVGKIEKTIENKFQQFVETLKTVAGKVHQFTLTLIRKMFKFLGGIQKIAEENKWNIREIVVEMPSCDVNVITVAGVPIPIPKINTPKLTITFAPAE